MIDLPSIGAQIAHQRKKMSLTQTELARKAGVSRATVDALENGRSGGLGFMNLVKLLAPLGLELKLQAAELRRPTLEDLMRENDEEGQNQQR
jgi:transcriptional regulator with XRE-family HTH domain